MTKDSRVLVQLFCADARLQPNTCVDEGRTEPEYSKFILTIRDNEDEWYDSLIRFYKQSFPSFTSPQQIEYILPGVIYKILTECWGGTKEDPYNKKQLTQSYLNHIKDVKTYFKDREDDLLIVNLKDKDLTLKLENFIGVKFANKKIPHLNRTK